MKTLLSLILFINFSILFAQDYRVEAEDEFQEILKDYKNFDVEKIVSKKFKFIRGFSNVNRKKISKRHIDFDWKESIYQLVINFEVDRVMKVSHYQIHLFEKNNSILGLVAYNKFHDKTSYYFENHVLEKYIQDHNDFYKTNSTVEIFLVDIVADETFGNCGGVIYPVPQYNNISYGEKKNLHHFTSMIKSYNPELQSNAVEAFEYMDKKKILKTKNDIRTIINHIKKRNSVLRVCVGCLVQNSKVF